MKKKNSPKRLDLREIKKSAKAKNNRKTLAPRILEDVGKWDQISCCPREGDVVIPTTSGAWEYSGSWYLNYVSKVGIFLMPQTYTWKINVTLVFLIGFQDYILWAWRNLISLALTAGACGRWGVRCAMRTPYSCHRYWPLLVLLSQQSTQAAAKPSSSSFSEMQGKASNSFDFPSSLPFFTNCKAWKLLWF